MYGYSKELDLSFEEALQKTKDSLQKQGFGIITTIDVKKTLKEKLDAEFDEYTILGACIPKEAKKALELEKEMGFFFHAT